MPLLALDTKAGTAGSTISADVFTNLLASAYCLQQKHERMKSRFVGSQFRDLISTVLDSERLVRHSSIDADSAMHLIASRINKLCGAAGTAIVLLDEENLQYKVAIGIAEAVLGSKVRAHDSSSFQQLKGGQAVQSNTRHEKELGKLVVGMSVLSVPIFAKGTLTGCIQLFSRHAHFSEETTYTCELMSTVLSQLIGQTQPAGPSTDSGQLPMPTNHTESRIEDSKLQHNVLQEMKSGNLQLSATAESGSSDDLVTPSRLEDPPSHGRSKMPGLRWPNPSPEHMETASSCEEELDQQLLALCAQFQNDFISEDHIETQSEQIQPSAGAVINSPNAIHSDTVSMPLEQAPMVPAVRQRAARVKALIYPFLVLVYGAMMSLYGGLQPSPLRLATIVVIVLSAIDLSRRWSDD